MSQKVTAIAPSNIALVKYWGKSDVKLNLPLAGSISVTLDSLLTTTTVELDESLSQDELYINDEVQQGTTLKRASDFLDLLRKEAKTDSALRIHSKNTFPTAAGLASSASGFAALTLAASEALGLQLDDQLLSTFARRGSGSACRSMFGGFVLWRRLYGEELFPQDHWDLRVTVLVLNHSPKEVSSRDAMQHCVQTSPYTSAWWECVMQDLENMRDAIADKDFEAMGQLAEQNCLAMHAMSMAARPPIVFWSPQTLELIQQVWALRKQDHKVYFTIDAGPHLFLLSPPKEQDFLERFFTKHPAVEQVIACQPGKGAALTDEHLV